MSKFLKEFNYIRYPIAYWIMLQMLFLNLEFHTSQECSHFKTERLKEDFPCYLQL